MYFETEIDTAASKKQRPRRVKSRPARLPFAAAMVRETRHLWVGNLPARFPEDRIKEHFKRYTIIYLMPSFFLSLLSPCPLRC